VPITAGKKRDCNNVDHDRITAPPTKGASGPGEKTSAMSAPRSTIGRETARANSSANGSPQLPGAKTPQGIDNKKNSAAKGVVKQHPAGRKDGFRKKSRTRQNDREAGTTPHLGAKISLSREEYYGTQKTSTNTSNDEKKNLLIREQKGVSL